MVVSPAATLGTDLHDDATLLYRRQRHVRIVHRFGKGFFTIRILAFASCFRKVVSMLEVGRADDYRVYITTVIEFLIITEERHIASCALADKRTALIPPPAPDVRQCSQFKIHCWRMCQDRRE